MATATDRALQLRLREPIELAVAALRELEVGYSVPPNVPDMPLTFAEDLTYSKIRNACLKQDDAQAR